MIPINVSLSHYKRRDIQEEIIANSKDREVAARFNDSFAKRPDILRHPSDILELAKQGATSFHASEELWRNPLQLDPSLKRHELDNLRIGWDMIIDVDCPIWEYSKVITAFIIQSLRENHINSISCKFSGNKGFHIGIPFETFPPIINKKETRLLFPDGVKIIAAYLINEEIDKGNRLTNFVLKEGLSDMFEKTGKSKEELIKNFCVRCSLFVERQKEKFEYTCPKCLRSKVLEENIPIKCEKCNIFMTKKNILKYLKEGDHPTKFIEICPKCGNKDLIKRLDLQKILNIDSLLISSRHLYRMPYSLHEKSGLVSIPIDPGRVLFFKKEDALPQNVKVSKYKFLDKEKASPNESISLFDKAFTWNLKFKEYSELKKKEEKEFEAPDKALPEELFPPCISIILNGIDEGRKRALFILINYFSSIGWDYEMIEKKLKEWNAKNREPLRDVYLLGQLRYHKQMRKRILPPNCSNEMYMLGIGVCKPDSFCQKIKNPAQYTTKKAWLINRSGKSRKS